MAFVLVELTVEFSKTVVAPVPVDKADAVPEARYMLKSVVEPVPFKVIAVVFIALQSTSEFITAKAPVLLVLTGLLNNELAIFTTPAELLLAVVDAPVLEK